MKKVDATSGPLLKLIIVYTIPLILSTIMQSMFNIADKAVLGNMAGSTAVASIGATATVINLVINGAVGLSTGSAIVLARYVGQKNAEKMRETIDTALISAVIFGTIVAVVGVIVAPSFLKATNCPADCYDGAVLYMRICLAGAPATLLYNYGSSILRTLGDTRRPLIYVAVSGLVNVALNVILCFVLTEKVAAVAIATIVSRIISAVLVLRRLTKQEDIVRISLKRLRFRFEAFWRILRFGVPTAISSLMVPLGNLQITTAINSFGVDAVAGNSAAISVFNIASAFTGGFGMATTTFMGQNIGAQQPNRVRQSFRLCLLLNIFISGSLGVLLYLSGELWLGLIVGMSETVAIEYGMQRLFYTTLFVFINAINSVLNHSLQAFGYPLFTSITNIAFNLGFRVLWMQFIYPLRPEFSTIMQCFTTSWTLNMIFYAIFVAIIYTRYVKRGICKRV